MVSERSNRNMGPPPDSEDCSVGCESAAYYKKREKKMCVDGSMRPIEVDNNLGVGFGRRFMGEPGCHSPIGLGWEPRTRRGGLSSVLGNLAGSI